MKVLVVGSGAREHALVWKCVQSDLVERVYCAPGNGGTGGMARNIPIGAADVVRLVDFARREKLGLVSSGLRRPSTPAWATRSGTRASPSSAPTAAPAASS